MRTREPREWGDWTDEDYIAHTGSATVLDPLELTDPEWRAERKKLREKIARKKPIGFAPDGAWREP